MASYSVVSKVPPGWKCDYCWGENPSAEGGTIAHEGGGEHHPIHLSCMVAWRLKSNHCVTCWRKTDADAVMGSALKVKLTADRLLEQLKQNFRSPMFRLGVGAVCTIIGSWKKQPMLSAVGWFFQWLTIHQIILYGGGHIEIAEKLEKLCFKLIVHFNEAQFKELQTVAQRHQRYDKILNDRPGIQGVKRLFKALEKEIRGDRIVRLYRLVAAFSALCFAVKACPLS